MYTSASQYITGNVWAGVGLRDKAVNWIILWLIYMRHSVIRFSV